MKMRLLCAPLLSLFLIFTSVEAQNLSALMDAIKKLEVKLENMVKQETNARIAADTRLKASISGKGAADEAAPPDSAMAAAIKNLTEAVKGVQFTQIDLAKHLNETSDKLQELEKKGDDARVTEMAQDLKVLIDELKKALKMEEKEEEEETEAMEVGGLVTVDFGADPTEMTSASAEIGEVDLSANVNVAPGLVASITLLAEGNLSAISIDEAFVEFAPEGKPFAFLFGQHPFNHGLLSTHLISDPMILDLVETIAPGLTINFSIGSFNPGIAVLFLHENEETEKEYILNLVDSTVTAEDVVVSKEVNLFAGIVNVDFSFLEESVARLSLKVYGDVVDLAAGTGLVVGPAAIDFEVFTELTDDDDAKASGYYAGLAYGITDDIEAAVRYDGLSEDQFADIEHRIGVGATFGFNYGIFCALEYAYAGLGTDEGAHEVALQLGLESTLKLPGFHRKTLTRK